MKPSLAIFVLPLAMLVPELQAQEPAADSKTLLQQGLFAEEAEQQLDKAAESYARIIGNYATERDSAVVAIFRLAEVRRKQERNAEAGTVAPAGHHCITPPGIRRSSPSSSRKA